MDYLNLKKQSRHHVILFIGYILIAVAVVLGARILVYQAYGFGLGKNGTVIQNGLLFFSSQPNPAKIYFNNQLQTVQTNTRMLLPEGIYHVRLTRAGYRDWQRTIELEGGSVQHFDYPFLIPKTLTDKKVQAFNGQPGLMTQSPDHRWLLIEDPGSLTNFNVYDLKNPTKPPTAIALPAALMTKANAPGDGWQLDEWADDNQHVVLQHNFDGKTEFILLDRVNPEKSLNLNKSLGANPAKLTLKNKKFDQYYLYDTTGTLEEASANGQPAAVVLKHVLAYKSYGNDTLLYVTGDGARPGKVWVKMRAGNTTYSLRSLPVSPAYLVDLTKYSGVMYVAAGDAADNKVYIFEDPAGQLEQRPNQAVVPLQVLHIPGPNYLSFSPNAQFIMASNGNYFGVYDIENANGYNYTAPEPLDAPQTHASWMDGNRLVYSSGGKLLVFDYDGTNHQTLTAAAGQYLPAFAPNYKDVYTLAPGSAGGGQLDLTDTSLLIPADR